MTSLISHTSIDCRDAYELSEWWKPVLGYTDVPDEPNEPGLADREGNEFCILRSEAEIETAQAPAT